MSYYPAAHWATKPTESWGDVQQETRGFFIKKGRIFGGFCMYYKPCLASFAVILERFWGHVEMGTAEH